MSDIPKVLIVDYEPKALKSLGDLLAQSGYVVDVAKDGVTALMMFKEGQPDIVLLEAMIPKKHGFEVCQEIKKSPQGKGTPVIIMTSVYKGRKHRTQAMHVHGCDEYVEKPCPPESILEIVKRFVPPGDIGLALAVGENKSSSSSSHSHEKLGEVIPFPAERTSYTLTDIDDDTEREIMSKLDEILPDTPMFDERGTGVEMEMASADAALVDDFDLDAEIAGTAETVERIPGGPGFSMDPPGDRKVMQPRRAAAMKADEVEKLTRARRRRPQEVEKEPFLSKTSIAILVVAGVLTLIIYLVGKV
jgi:CheY-like chemotaxis protein